MTSTATGAPVLLSVNVGMPKDVSWQGRTVYTGVWKHPVDGPAMVRRLNIDGDGQGDLAGHGGEQRAVLVYQIQSYRHWQQHFGRDDFTYGQFGENLTVDGLPDDEVCIGDRYRIGEAEFEVTQPRVTCYRVGLRLGEPELPALLVSHHRPGFYMRVITEGHVQAGDQIVKTRTGPGALSVADTDALLYLPGRDPAKLRARRPDPGAEPRLAGVVPRTAGRRGRRGRRRRPTEPAWAGFRPLRVTEVVPESATVSSIYLAAPDGSPLPAARAGQYLTLRITGAGQPAPVRSYSLSSAPGAGTYRISVKREPHGVVSSYLNRHAAARRDPRRRRAPRRLRPRRRHRPGAAHLGRHRRHPGAVHAAPARGRPQRRATSGGSTAPASPREHPLAAEAHALLAVAAARPRARVLQRRTADGAGRSTAPHQGHAAPARRSGRRRRLRLRAGLVHDRHAGRPAALGLDPARIHTELFGALASINPGLTGQPPGRRTSRPGQPGPGPLVTFARSGISTPFAAAGRSVLELADACDVPTRWSCRTGVCHTCTTPLLSGDVTYSPDPLEPPARRRGAHLLRPARHRHRPRHVRSGTIKLRRVRRRGTATPGSSRRSATPPTASRPPERIGARLGTAEEAGHREDDARIKCHSFHSARDRGLLHPPRRGCSDPRCCDPGQALP